MLDFLETYSSASDFSRRSTDSNQSQLSDTAGLEQRFQELTGLNPTPANIQAVANSAAQTEQDQVQDEQSDEDSEVPFQTESTQTQIKGAALRSLVDRLEKNWPCR